jgi:UDP-N-acetylmuramate dehydrogenase
MEVYTTLECLRHALGSDKIREKEPMSLHTTFKVGGPADIFITPESTGDVAAAVRICHEAGVPLLVIGNGSNLLVRDGGIRGVVVKLGERLAGMHVDDTVLVAQGGALLSHVAAEAARQGLCGMEFASGIPGSVGGASAMNAGAYEGEMKDIVQGVTAVTPEGEIVKLSCSDMEYGYRHSRALSQGLIITEVELDLVRGDMAASKALTEGYTASRRAKQPLEMPSAGSFFKRPPGYFAGKLISDAGLKGFTVGGAQVSEKHAGFIVNAGGATAADVLSLAEGIRERVRELYGVELEMEVRTVGEEL